jgi:phosphatidylserine decarboxylase
MMGMASARSESFKILGPLLIVLLAVIFLPDLARGILGAILAFLIVGTFYFFRDPERQAPSDSRLIVSAADGLVTHVERVEESPFGLGPATRVSVFLSVFDVHVNRVPYAGTMERSLHSPGRFLDARATDCATENERMDWLLRTAHGPVVIRQIAGLIARRIVGWIGENEGVSTGQRLGLIRFGSRTDLFLPLDVEVLVSVGDRVQGVLTPIARWNS